MYGAIAALLIALVMMVLVILKGRGIYPQTLYCTKAELMKVIDSISDDCIIQILIGGNSYEHKGAGNS